MPPISVTQAIAYISSLLNEDPVLSDVCVSGEVSRSTQSASGHIYFSLKDQNAAMDCVMFRGGVGDDHLVVGSSVLAFGRFSIYAQRGSLQLIADVVQPAGVGDLQEKLEELKKSLESEGLFEVSRKRQLPIYPIKIGVVTSEEGSVWHDIKQTVLHRYPNVELVLSPTTVQGSTASSSIARAIGRLDVRSDIDVIILARGGGSPEDLWSFNEESVARAIFASGHPVITGIGHETDWTISDMVADFRASTPTAAAVAAVPDITEISVRIQSYQGLLIRLANSLVNDAHKDFDYVRTRLESALPSFEQMKLRIDELANQLGRSMRVDLNFSTEKVKMLTDKLFSLGPAQTMSRGYSIVQNSNDGVLVRELDDVEPGNNITITVSDGTLEATVVDKYAN